MYELRSYRKPLIKGHQPIPLEPSSTESEIALINASQVLAETTRLFSKSDCWHITINEATKDANNNILRGTPHWCANIEQIQSWLAE